MANKTYNQYCAIAQALDIVGERWTLLIIRNLLAGPRRFSDLMKGLPGVSTNILTDRLKTLEANETITTRYLPPPAASSVYELTEVGYSLVAAMGALAQWGARSLGEPQADQHIVPESIIFMLLGVFWGKQVASVDLACDVHVQDTMYDEIFLVNLSASGVTISEQSDSDVDVTLTLALEPLLKLSSQHTTLKQSIADKQVTLTGTETKTQQVINWVDGT